MKRSSRRAVEALDRMRAHLESATTGRRSTEITVFEVTRIYDAWLAGKPWEETLDEREARRAAECRAPTSD